METSFTIKDALDIAQISKDTLLAFAILFGGIWSYFTYQTLREKDRARAGLQKTELEKKQIELEMEKLELGVRQQALVRLTLDINQSKLPGDDGYFLLINVIASNLGNRNTELRYNHNDHLTVTRYDVADDGTRIPGAVIKRTLKRANKKVDTNTLLAGDEAKLPFYVRVDSPGLYHVRFYTEPTEEERKVIMSVGDLDENSSIVWSANEYFVVE